MMEAGYSDIMDEEERAQEIADQEDEEEYQKQRYEKKVRKYRRLLAEGF